MTASVRSLVPCGTLDWDRYFTLERVRFSWPRPPARLFLWVEIHNPAEDDVSITVQVFRRATLVQESGEELLLGNSRRLEADIELVAGDLEPKTYTIRVLLNGVAAATLSLDFGAQE